MLSRGFAAHPSGAPPTRAMSFVQFAPEINGNYRLRRKFDSDKEKLFMPRVLQVVNEHVFGREIKVFRFALAIDDVDDASIVKARASVAVGQYRPKVWTIVTVKGQSLTRSKA